MVDRNLLRQYQVDDNELDLALKEALGGDTATAVAEDEFDLDAALDAAILEKIEVLPDFEPNDIVEGTVIRLQNDMVIVDIGFKAEGIVPASEWDDDEGKPKPGDKVEVLLEDVENAAGFVELSKGKARRIREWEGVMNGVGEGDPVTGDVLKKIKGGLLVDIGVHVFLPASQVDIRRPPDIGDYVGKKIECVVLKIDELRRNIVVSRRKLIEDRRKEMKEKLLAELNEGVVRRGVVKNIADFGAFVDLGGIDGLLHITDMSYDRLRHPTEMVKIEDEIDVMVLHIDREKEKIALGIKQMYPDPWAHVEERYPVGAQAHGEVVNIMTYGAFVKLEPGIEGLVHISEMSWVRRINHPTELVNIGDEVEVQVLGINLDKKEISLGMKQCQSNPWDDVMAKYPEGKKVTGVVRNLTNYGAFVELEEGVDGLLHVSDMSWTKKLSHANELLKKGEELTTVVISVDEERKRIALGLKQMDGDPWETTIPDRFGAGTIHTGTVTKVTNFGVFVELEEDLEGLLHVSELADHKVDDPEKEVQPGQEIQVRVLRLDMEERKIGLSRKLEVTAEELAAEQAAYDEQQPKEKELKGGTGGDAGPLFQMPAGEDEEDEG